MTENLSFKLSDRDFTLSLLSKPIDEIRANVKLTYKPDVAGRAEALLEFLTNRGHVEKIGDSFKCMYHGYKVIIAVKPADNGKGSSLIIMGSFDALREYVVKCENHFPRHDYLSVRGNFYDFCPEGYTRVGNQFVDLKLIESAVSATTAKPVEQQKAGVTDYAKRLIRESERAGKTLEYTVVEEPEVPKESFAEAAELAIAKDERFGRRDLRRTIYQPLSPLGEKGYIKRVLGGDADNETGKIFARAVKAAGTYAR